MSTDRELLELAAKAAGILLDYSIRPDGKAFYHSDRNALAMADGGWFAPLADDSDALRLAVALHIGFWSDTSDACCSWAPFGINPFTEGMEQLAEEVVNGDRLAAARRAIVRAAAEIGRAMP